MKDCCGNLKDLGSCPNTQLTFCNQLSVKTVEEKGAVSDFNVSSDSAPIFVCFTPEKRALQQICCYKVGTSRDELYLPSSWRKMKRGQRLIEKIYRAA